MQLGNHSGGNRKTQKRTTHPISYRYADSSMVLTIGKRGKTSMMRDLAQNLGLNHLPTILSEYHSSWSMKSEGEKHAF